MVTSQPGVSCARLERELLARLPGLEGRRGLWRARVRGFDLYVDADERADRLRLMVPVARADHDDLALLLVLLSANFDRAVDARYAIHDGLVWCLFLCRLSDLTPPMLDHAIEAVITLAANTGSTFSSGGPRPGAAPAVC